MERREFLTALAGCTTAFSLLQIESLCAAAGFHEEGPYNGALLVDYVKSTCGACPGGCGIQVRRVDGIPVKIDGSPVHPVSRGGLCPVGASSLALLVHPDRIRQPLLRSGPRGSGQFSAISWEEAESLARTKLSDLMERHEPERLLFLDSREWGPGVELARKFAADFGTPNFYTTSDPSTRVAAAIWGGDDVDFGYDLENARLILCFGHPVFEAGNNPVYTAGLRSRLLDKPEGQKGSFVIIDSRLSASAAKARQWVPIKPGTQGLLALGLMYIIIKEQVYDKDFVSRFCVGFEDETDRDGNEIEGFKSFVLKNYYPAFVSEQTGVPLDQIIGLARSFANTPRAVAISGGATSQTVDSAYQVWAVMALNALTGRLGAPGGTGALKPFPLKKPAWSASKAEPIVAASSRQFPYLADAGAVESLPEGILAGTPYSIELAIFNNVNPVYDSPQANRFRQALQNIPFSIAIASLQNETSLMADLVLPDCTFLEKHDLILPRSDFSHPVVGLMQPAIGPLHDSRQADDVLLALGRTLFAGEWEAWDSYPSYIRTKAKEIYDSNVGSLFSDEFKVSFESLLAERGWRRTEFRDFDSFWKQFQTAGGWWDPLPQLETSAARIPTPSGKFYFNSSPLRSMFPKAGEDLRESLEKSGLRIESGSEFLLGSYRAFGGRDDSAAILDLYLIELTTLRGDGGRMHKMADMVGYYDNVKWKSWVELNPETAHDLGLADNQEVWVESAYGKLRMTLRLNPGLVPGTAAAAAGMGKWGTYRFGENINSILSTARDCLAGIPARAETKVRVYSSV